MVQFLEINNSEFDSSDLYHLTRAGMRNVDEILKILNKGSKNVARIVSGNSIESIIGHLDTRPSGILLPIDENQEINHEDCEIFRKSIGSQLYSLAASIDTRIKDYIEENFYGTTDENLLNIREEAEKTYRSLKEQLKVPISKKRPNLIQNTYQVLELYQNLVLRLNKKNKSGLIDYLQNFSENLDKAIDSVLNGLKQIMTPKKVEEWRKQMIDDGRTYDENTNMYTKKSAATVDIAGYQLFKIGLTDNPAERVPRDNYEKLYNLVYCSLNPTFLESLRSPENPLLKKINSYSASHIY